MVRCYYSVDLVGGESDKLSKDRVGMGGRKMEAGIKEELMSFTFWVQSVTKSSAVRQGGGVGEGGSHRSEVEGTEGVQRGGVSEDSSVDS
jgi:hypothetical protein